MRYVTKEFLSPSPDESGSVICTIKTVQVKDFTSYGYSIREGGHMSASVRIADCSDHVILDFDVNGQKGFEKRTAKLDKLIGELQAMRKQMGEMWASHQRDIEYWKRTEGAKDAA